MGIVFLGRDVALERPVAIKVLRPEHATAAATERFLREARILASLNHPNVVTVHRAGESGGLSWYVMDYLPAETLAGRLERGPLGAGEAVAVALDVLAALEAAHRHGVVHRDVKPANIFLLQGRAQLGDFGIASSPHAGEPLTLPGRILGTPDYMAPEQMVGKPATPATDLCGVGLVLFEALTGERYEAWEHPAEADWTRVPRPLAPVVRRALALDPAARWPDAGSFAAALRRFGRASRARRLLWAAAAVAVVAAGIAGWLARGPSLPRKAATLQVVVSPFRVGGAAAPAWLGDSLAHALVRALGANTDFLVRFAAAAPDTARGLVLDGRGTVRGAALEIGVTPARPTAGIEAFRADTSGPLAAWDRVAAALAYQVLLQLWSQRNAALAGDLPLAAAPRTAAGLRAFLAAEQLFAHAQWASAYRAYVEARALDATCLICDVRIADVARWLGTPPDTPSTRRYRAALQRFPPQYQALLRAGFEPADVRLATLRELTERSRNWGFAWFHFGDEVFHRGVFSGYRREDALEPLLHASLLRPDFAPVWEHLAWEATAVGDSADAAHALEAYGRIASSGDHLAKVLGGLLQTGFVWRFLPEAQAIAFTTAQLKDPAVAHYEDLAAAPSYMLTFEAPRATVWIGEQFARGVPRRDLENAGLLAQVYGLVALGRVDSALAVARQLGARASDPDIVLFAEELPVALALADSEAVATRWMPLAAPLEPMAEGVGHADTLQRARAAWMLALLAYRAQRRAEFDRYRALVEAAGPAAVPLAQFLTAVAGRGGHGMPAAALRYSAPLAALDSANRGHDPFFRTLLHLERAAWQLGAGTPAQAVAELRWHDNNDFVDYPGRAPQAAEVDYAFATLARWDGARVLESLGPAHREEACATFAAVAAAWREGEPRYAARAALARERYAALECGRTP